MTYRITDVSLPGGWKQRQDRAREKARLWQERMNDPDVRERDRQIAEQREAAREAREREIAERNDRASCPCCRAGSFNRADLRKMTRLMIREMGFDAVSAILNDDPADLVKVPVAGDPVRAALVQAFEDHDESESLDPARDPVPGGQEPARRGRGRPPKTSTII
ncbi:hypothetical protein [Methylobacterium nonmethylotrophicum]|uniref:Uncharacterized protein n=1 Tax=Methylobacterium nonmethylotrophicum TaxID=1141884 RepID=A0A4Z0NEE5_9HYPH|nr:hypothetical protein [Methylobacterium nonmethylotrophicum]TGD91912.1 hypothetical protein EU555_35390 [Methylobacterium nonmethylotrophicum]